MSAAFGDRFGAAGPAAEGVAGAGDAPLLELAALLQADPSATTPMANTILDRDIRVMRSLSETIPTR